MERGTVCSSIGLFISALIVMGLLIHPITVEIGPMNCTAVEMGSGCRLYTNTGYYGGSISCRDGNILCYPYMTIINHHATNFAPGHYEYRINVTTSKYQAQFDDSMQSLMYGMCLVVFSITATGTLLHLIYIAVRTWSNRPRYVTIASADLEASNREII